MLQVSPSRRSRPQQPAPSPRHFGVAHAQQQHQPCGGALQAWQGRGDAFERQLWSGTPTRPAPPAAPAPLPPWQLPAPSASPSPHPAPVPSGLEARVAALEGTCGAVQALERRLSELEALPLAGLARRVAALEELPLASISSVASRVAALEMAAGDRAAARAGGAAEEAQSASDQLKALTLRGTVSPPRFLGSEAAQQPGPPDHAAQHAHAAPPGHTAPPSHQWQLPVRPKDAGRQQWQQDATAAAAQADDQQRARIDGIEDALTVLAERMDALVSALPASDTAETSDVARLQARVAALEAAHTSQPPKSAPQPTGMDTSVRRRIADLETLAGGRRMEEQSGAGRLSALEREMDSAFARIDGLERRAAAEQDTVHARLREAVSDLETKARLPQERQQQELDAVAHRLDGMEAGFRRVEATVTGLPTGSIEAFMTGTTQRVRSLEKFQFDAEAESARRDNEGQRAEETLRALAKRIDAVEGGAARRDETTGGLDELRRQQTDAAVALRDGLAAADANAVRHDAVLEQLSQDLSDVRHAVAASQVDTALRRLELRIDATQQRSDAVEEEAASIAAMVRERDTAAGGDIAQLHESIERLSGELVGLVEQRAGEQEQARREQEERQDEVLKRLAELTLKADSEATLALRLELDERMQELHTAVGTLRSDCERHWADAPTPHREALGRQTHSSVGRQGNSLSVARPPPLTELRRASGASSPTPTGQKAVSPRRSSAPPYSVPLQFNHSSFRLLNVQ